MRISGYGLRTKLYLGGSSPNCGFFAFAMLITFHQQASRFRVSSMRLFGRGDSSLTERDFDLVDSFLI
jgi:hypothetical protein